MSVRYVEKVREYLDAGVEHVYIHKVGPNQEGSFRFLRTELVPALSELTEHEPAVAGS